MVAFAAGALSSLATGLGTAATSVGATSIGSGLASAGGSIASAGTATAGASLFSGATPSIFASILQGGTGLISAMGAMRQGQAQADSLNMQASTAEMDAAQQGITATSQTTGLKKQLVATLGQRDVAYGASGIDLSFGTPAVAHEEAVSDASDAIAATNDNAAAQSSQLMARAAMYRKMAGSAQDAGDVSAVGDIVGAGAKILARG